MANSKSVFGYRPARDLRRRQLDNRLGERESWVDTVLPGGAETGSLEQSADKRPLWWLALTVGLVLVILIGRLASLQLIHGRRNLGLADGNRLRQKVTRAPRGVLYDRNRQPLARNVASFDVTVTPQALPTGPERGRIFDRLSGYIGVPAVQIAAKAETRDRPSGEARLILAGLDRTKALELDQYLGQLPGINLDINPVREYSDGGLMAHVLGYTGRVTADELKAGGDYQPTDYIGKLGLEKQYESLLRGVNGREQTEVDARGQPVKVLASRPAQPGSNLILSVDRGLNAKLAETLSAQLSKSGAKRAAGVAIDPRNGEVLAAVSLPGYDDNLFSRGISEQDYHRLTADPGQPLFNKATAGAYPSGSIIKPLVASAALQERVVTPQTTIVDSGKLVVVNKYNPAISYTFNGWEHSGLGVMDIYRAIAKSSDIYFYTVGGGFEQFVGLGIERLANYYQKFGLGQKTGVDLPEETAGRVPTPDWKKQVKHEDWFTGDTYNTSVGQGDILVSPLQMATATAAIANGGTLLKPHFLKAELDNDGKIKRQVGPEPIRGALISPNYLTVVREAMRQTVTSGTACCSFDQAVGVPVAGKTGTAETDPGRTKPHAWFTAFAPADKPEIVVAVVLENAGEGNEFALPAVRDTLAWYFHPH